MQNIQFQLGGLRVMLVLQLDGRAAFVKTQQGHTFDTGEEVEARFYDDAFCFFDDDDEQEYEYNHLYNPKEHPLMLGWLQQQAKAMRISL